MAMTITAYVVLWIAGIAALQALIWIPIILRFRRRYRAAYDRLAAEIEAETVICPLEKAVYTGATAPGFPRVRNNGRIALTRRRLVFVTFTGKTFDIPVEAITGVRESKVFKGQVVVGRTHLVIATRSGEIGFLVGDTSAWIGALTMAIG